MSKMIKSNQNPIVEVDVVVDVIVDVVVDVVVLEVVESSL